jgi:hypothetical protein
MPVSPADFALWARETGNKYPETAQEKLAAAPHAYAHAKNFGKSGSNAPGTRVGGSILYDQPAAVENKAPNSLFNSPVTPDNRAPKVAGTLDPTLTGEQFRNEEGQEVAERTRQHSFIDTIGKTALAAGAVAAGVALARNPAAQQAIRTAGTSISENAQNIGSRVSDFLGGLGGGRNVDPDVIRNSGDVTPPTTGQRYQQEQIPVATQEIQMAKGAPTGSAAEATLPPTTESYGVKPVTESDVITSSQTFAPRSKSEVIQSVLSKMPLSTQEAEYTPDILDPRDLGTQSFQTATKFASPEVIAARRADLRGEVNPSVGAPLIDRVTGEIRNPEISVPGYKEAFPGIGERVKDFLQPETGAAPIGVSTGDYGAQPQVDVSEQTAKLDPGAILRSSPLFQVSPEYLAQHPEGASGLHQTLTTKTGHGAPARHGEVARPTLGGRSLVRIAGGGVQPETATTEQSFDPGEFATSGARDVTSFTNKPAQRFAGERDIEASLATQETQGVFPTGQFSSLASGEQYEPAILHRLSSMIDPRVVTQGEQGARQEVSGYLGGKAAWMQKAEEQAELRRQTGLQEATQRLGTLKQQERQATDKKAKTFLKQALGLYDVTQDPAVLESAAQQAMPLEVTLPGGETVPTQSFFKPFGAVGSGEGSNLTLAQLLENNLIGKQTTYGNTKAGILANLGVEPTAKLTASMFNSLPQSARKALTTAHTEMMDARSRLQSARDNEILFSVPENILEGTKTTPIISSTTGDVVGMTSVPEEKTLDPLEFYRMRAGGGVGRSEVGGVGRRREALADLGYSTEGAVSDVTPVLYQDLNTGEVLHADDVSLAQIANKVVKPIRGSAVEPQRLMGKGDRSYKGISADVIDPGSFDPTQRAALAEAYPERVTPEGLIYTKKATEEVPSAGQMHVREELSPTMRGLRSAPTSRTVTSPEQAYAQAMLHAAVWGGEPTRAPLSGNVEEVQAAPVRTVREARPQQLSIPGAGLASQIRSTPALEEALATERYMGSRPGTNLRSAMQKALAKASVQQPTLF